MVALEWVLQDPVQAVLVSTDPAAGAVAIAPPRLEGRKPVAFPWVQLSSQVLVLQVCATLETWVIHTPTLQASNPAAAHNRNVLAGEGSWRSGV